MGGFPHEPDLQSTTAEQQYECSTVDGLYSWHTHLETMELKPFLVGVLQGNRIIPGLKTIVCKAVCRRIDSETPGASLFGASGVRCLGLLTWAPEGHPRRTLVHIFTKPHGTHGFQHKRVRTWPSVL